MYIFICTCIYIKPMMTWCRIHERRSAQGSQKNRSSQKKRISQKGRSSPSRAICSIRPAGIPSAPVSCIPSYPVSDVLSYPVSGIPSHPVAGVSPYSQPNSESENPNPESKTIASLGDSLPKAFKPKPESENQNPGSQTRFSMEESLPKAFAAAAFLPPTPGQTPLASR